MMDVVEHYDPDFIYTDGTDTQPFSGKGTGTGLKADAMQRVIADFYNRTLKRRGKVDTFSIVKFRPRTNGTVNTEEHGIPRDIKTDQPWIAEAPVGDWFYRPGFTYDSGMMIRYIIEAAARDGNACVCISPLPDGSLDVGSERMLKEVGVWVRRSRTPTARMPIKTCRNCAGWCAKDTTKKQKSSPTPTGTVRHPTIALIKRWEI